MMLSAFSGASPQRRQHILKNKNRLLSSVGPIFIDSHTVPSQKELNELIILNGGKVCILDKYITL